MTSNASNQVGVLAAKTNLSQLLERVERGETIVITRHGAPVARLVPYADVADAQGVRDAVHELLGWKGPRLGKITLQQLIRAGRK